MECHFVLIYTLYTFSVPVKIPVSKDVLGKGTKLHC